MKTYLECWIGVAKSLLSQALAGEPQLVEPRESKQELASGLAFAATLTGDLKGRLTVVLDPAIEQSPLMGEGAEQRTAWHELLREVAEAAAGEFNAAGEKKCRVDSLEAGSTPHADAVAFQLVTAGSLWDIAVFDETEDAQFAAASTAIALPQDRSQDRSADSSMSAGLQLLLDVELEAALRFGCCEMSLGEILELGPGDVMELDRQVSDPADLIVGDKIVARGDVVVINGNFGLRVTEVAEPQKRLESIRCLF